MTPILFTGAMFLISIIAGLFGSLLGLGGGIIVVPALTLLFGIDIRYAIGASIVSVIATSSGAAAAYVREHLTNMRVGMLLEVGTTAGAVSGAYLGGLISPKWLYITFSLVLAYSAWSMLRRRVDHSNLPVRPDRLADRLRLHGSYYDESLGRVVDYRVTHAWVGLAPMYLAGIISGLLGVGGGVMKVPVMDLVMRLPIKVSTATSNFMIGVTAAASAGVYFSRGDIDPFIAGPVATGIVFGAITGSRLLGKLQNRTIRVAFVLVLFFVAAQMMLKGLR